MRRETIDAINEANALLQLDKSPKYDPLMTVDLDARSLHSKDSSPLVAPKEIGSPSVRSVSALSTLSITSTDVKKAQLIIEEEKTVLQDQKKEKPPTKIINCCVCTIL